MTKRLAALLLAAALMIGGVSFASYRAYKGYQQAQRRKAIIENRVGLWAGLKRSILRDARTFDGTVAFVIEDLGTGIEISDNRDVLIPSASVVKIPIMAACFYAEAEGRLRLDEKMAVTRARKVPGSGDLKFVKPGTEFTLERLMRLMITHSDNTAANMLIERLGDGYLNGCFKRMGMRNTNLSRMMMDFKSRRLGIENYTTARDIALVLERIYRGRLASAASSKRCLEILAEQKVNDRIPKKLPAGTVVAHKTGLENAICHDAGIVYTLRGNFLIVVLTRHNYKYAAESKTLIADMALAAYKLYAKLPKE